MPIIETGRANADKFFNTVKRMSKDGRIIILYADDRRNPWPWMRNPTWQNCVLDLLEKNGFDFCRDAQFHPADNVDGLCFTAISTAGYSRVELLTLMDTIDGRTPPTGFWNRFKWVMTSFVGAFA